jgi:hypothetical protein
MNQLAEARIIEVDFPRVDVIDTAAAVVESAPAKRIDWDQVIDRVTSGAKWIGLQIWPATKAAGRGIAWAAAKWWAFAKFTKAGFDKVYPRYSCWRLDVRGDLNCETLRSAVEDMDKSKSRQLNKMTARWTRAKRAHTVRVALRRLPKYVIVGGVGWYHLTHPMILALLVDVGIITTVAGLLGAYGHPRGEELARKVRSMGPINDRLIISAFANLRIRQLGDADAVQFLTPVVGDEHGTSFTVLLPNGVSANDIMRRQIHERFAGGLNSKRSQVLLSVGETENQLVVEILKHAPAEHKVGAWAYANGGEVDIFDGIIFAESDMGDAVRVKLVQSNLLWIGKSGSYKSDRLRALVAAALKDPIVDPWLYDGKGADEFENFKDDRVVQWYVRGNAATNDEVAYAGLRLLRAAAAEVERRMNIIADTPGVREVTRELAAADARLRVILLVMDEIKTVLAHPTFGKEARTITSYLLGTARAAAVIPVFSTQTVDGEGLTWNIAANFLQTMAFEVTASDVQALKLNGSGLEDVRGSGHGIFDDGTGNPQHVFLPRASDEQQRRVVEEAAAARANLVRPTPALQEKLERRSAEAVSDPASSETLQLLSDVRAVRRGNEIHTWIERLLPVLQANEDFGARYADMGVAELTDALRKAMCDRAEEGVKKVAGYKDGGERTNRVGVVFKVVDDLLKGGDR